AIRRVGRRPSPETRRPRAPGSGPPLASLGQYCSDATPDCRCPAGFPDLPVYAELAQQLLHLPPCGQILEHGFGTRGRERAAERGFQCPLHASVLLIGDNEVAAHPVQQTRYFPSLIRNGENRPPRSEVFVQLVRYLCWPPMC